jgi:hypothetical protein
MHSIHWPGSVFLIALRRSSDQTTATAPTMDALSQPGMFCGRGHRATAPAARLATLLATPLHAPALLRLRRFGDATDLAPCDREAHAHARFGLEADPATAARSTILVANSGSAHGRSHAHAHSGCGSSALATSAPLPVSASLHDPHVLTRSSLPAGIHDEGTADQPPPAKKTRVSPSGKAKIDADAAAAAADAATTAAAAKDIEEDALLDEAIADNERLLASSAGATDASEAKPPTDSGMAPLTARERQRARKRAARGTPDANGGEIKTDHKHMCGCTSLPPLACARALSCTAPSRAPPRPPCADGRNDLYWLVRDHHEAALRLYANEQRDMLGRRFITDRPGTGKRAKAPLSLNRTNAMGCSERAVARELMSDEFKDMLDKLHASVTQDKRFKNLSIDELDKALLWGCLRYQAWPKEVAKAVLHEAGCFFGLLLPLNVYAGGFATAEHERKCMRSNRPTHAHLRAAAPVPHRSANLLTSTLSLPIRLCADAWYHHQSELGRMHYMRKFFETTGQIDHNHVGTGRFELDVAQAGVDGRARTFAFDSRDDFCRIIATLRVGSADVAGAPHVQPEDEPDGGRAYALEFVRTFGDPDGHHLMPAARGWTIYRLVDGARTRLCGRESWGMGSVIPDAVGIPEGGQPLSGERDDTLGFSKLLTPPRDTRERRREAKTLRAYEQKAKEALVAEAGHSDDAAAAAEAVMAVIVLCGERHKTLDEEFAPQLAAARGAVLAACPTLQKKLDDYLERSKVLAMHDARAQVLGHLAASVACLDPESRAQLELALAQHQTDEVERLRKQARTANAQVG